MDKKKENLLGKIALATALSAAATFGITKVRRHFQVPESKIEQIVQETPKPEIKAAYVAPAVDYSISKDAKTGLAIVENRDSFQFYGDRVLKGGNYRRVDADLYELLMRMADAYKSEFNQKLFVGPMWDDQGHSKNSKHYRGLAVDIDFGANIGTEQYQKTDRKKAEFLLRYIQKYEKEHNKDFKVIFNDKDFIKEGLCAYFEGHHNHIHIGK